MIYDIHMIYDRALCCFGGVHVAEQTITLETLLCTPRLIERKKNTLADVLILDMWTEVVVRCRGIDMVDLL